MNHVEKMRNASQEEQITLNANADGVMKVRYEYKLQCGPQDPQPKMNTLNEFIEIQILCSCGSCDAHCKVWKNFSPISI